MPNQTVTHPLEKVACLVPHWRFEVHAGGEIFHCCPSWLPTSLGNIKDISILSASASELSRQIRKSTRDGSFTYCKQDACPVLSTYLNTGAITASLIDKTQPDARFFSMEKDRHVSIMLCYDHSCNLVCPSCRNEKTLHSEATVPEDLRLVHDAFLQSLEELLVAGYHVRVGLTGSGDPFASPLYYKFMRELEFSPRLTLELQTNGVLMEEGRFTSAMKKMVRTIHVSVDGATRETYDQIRVQGSFPRVKKNLEWMNGARLAGEFPKLIHLRANMVVQKGNFREMPEFARWLLEYESIDQISFNKILDWGHMPAQAFFDKAVWREDHPEHASFLGAIRDPFLRSSPRIHLGNLAHFV